MRKHTTDILVEFLDKVALAGKTRTKEIRLPYNKAVELNSAITELLANLHDRKSSKPSKLDHINIEVDGGNFR